jgi:hypothetical protein
MLAGIPSLNTDPNDVNSPTTDDDKEKAGILASQFNKVQTREDTSKIPRLEKIMIEYQMQELVITKEMVLKVLQNLKVNKSPGIDNLPPLFLKEVAEEIAEAVAILYQKSLDRSVLPVDWISAIVAAIFKKGKKSLPENYRPVSLTCILCKCLEVIIREHIVDHMYRNCLFSNYQYGFLKGRSTTLQLLFAIEEWMEALDNGYEIDCVYTDFSKAFDTVPHQRLLGKLEAYGISEQIVKWIEAFLVNRRQRVVVNGQYSEWDNILSGVPQGSVLGPVLFVIFINDLPAAVISRLLLYADDAKIYRMIKEIQDQVSLQTDLHCMSLWAEKWQQRFHPDKLKYVTLSNKRKSTERVYYVGTDKVQKSRGEKDIGVLIDDKLNFKTHIMQQVKKANSMVGAIRRSFRFLDERMFRLLYKGLVRAHIETSVIIWNPYTSEMIDAIESVQKRATRMIPGYRDMTYEERNKSLDLPSLRYRRIRMDLLETYKILNCKYDTKCTPKLIMKENQDRTRGNKNALVMKRARTELRRNSFTHRIVPLWNSLPEEVVTAPSIDSFKERLDKIWKKKQPLYYSHKATITGVLSKGVTHPCEEERS